MFIRVGCREEMGWAHVKVRVHSGRLMLAQLTWANVRHAFLGICGGVLGAN